ncbi:tRNA 2-selenouridine synthase [Hylemonella gracilis str. Niagara R]|uniref:tRNA 2-selenouridine synthase n=1 Tax=Hylemonella gracilis str. Niagara R TaxID=1458275 RepID=A0A016XJ65_9BURK|nr:tRNA 2-selenouridine(34) synthase MnmH [Hylemonella gracilis]EYC51268.1 tRNA 2-selenouridine synthase [Hylemonella gracilis str. Niagara R]
MQQILSAEEALRRLDAFDAVLDARSESEYAEDHLPEAQNWPTLNDAERHEVGLLHRSNPFEARKRGAMIAARNIATHIEREVLDKSKDWKPLIYCWRGGKRSGSLALILSEIGFYVTRIDGGYKAFRNAVLTDIPRLATGLDWRVICGATGSGKTRLLHALSEAGAQTLDLEALACHRSSVLGALPGQPQPTQKAFDTQIWNALRRFDPARPVYVESESKKVGNVAVPDALMAAMRAAPCLHLLLPEDERVALLLEDYPHYAQDTAGFCARLDALTELRGKKTVAHWQNLVQTGQLQEVVRDLLRTHYDPGYQQSSLRNFTRFAEAPELHPRDRSMAAMQALARQMLAG